MLDQRKGAEPIVANTYTQIYIQIVFAVEGRQNLIDPVHNDELQKYITGIVTAQRQKLIVINNMPDQVRSTGQEAERHIVCPRTHPGGWGEQGEALVRQIR